MCCGFAKQVLLRALALCFDEIFVSGEREQHVQPSAELTAIGMKRKASALKTAKATTTHKVGYPIAKERLQLRRPTGTGPRILVCAPMSCPSSLPVVMYASAEDLESRRRCREEGEQAGRRAVLEPA